MCRRHMLRLLLLLLRRLAATKRHFTAMRRMVTRVVVTVGKNPSIIATAKLTMMRLTRWRRAMRFRCYKGCISALPGRMVGAMVL